MPITIYGPDKGARAVRRQIRALPLLDQTLEAMGAPVSVVRGNIKYAPAAVCVYASVESTYVREDPLCFSRMDVSPGHCAELDRGEPGMGIRAAVSGETAAMLATFIPAGLTGEAVETVLTDGQRVLDAARAAWQAGNKAASTIIQHAGHRHTHRDAERWANACAFEGVRDVFNAAPGAPAPHIWPDYWLAAITLAMTEERRLAANTQQPRARTDEELALKVFVAAHMPYEGEMISDDPRWSLPRRLLETGVARMQARTRVMQAAFGELRAALAELPASPREQVRRALAAASHAPSPEASRAARGLANDVHAFGSDSGGIEATRLAEPLFDRLVERNGGIDAAFAVVRDACLHIIHVTAMTKTCCPASAEARAGVLRLVGEHPSIGMTLACLGQVVRPSGQPDERRTGDAPTRKAATEAYAACNFFTGVLALARDNAGGGRAAALVGVNAALDAVIARARANEAGNRHPTDLWRIIVGGGGVGSLIFPGAWPDMEDGIIADINGFGRTGDREAFAALAGALRAGLEQKLATERAAALPDPQQAALVEAGGAYARISTALSEGTRREERYRTMADDMAVLRRNAAALPELIASPVVAAITRKLVYEFGVRDGIGCRTHDEERHILPHEVQAAKACVTWLVAEAANAPLAETGPLRDAAGQVALAAESAREVAEILETADPAPRR